MAPKIQTGIILQARMGSSRLPGKVLKPMGNSTILGQVFERCSNLRQEHLLVVATSVKMGDDCISDYCQEYNIPVFRGSEENVLQRYYNCAKLHNMQSIVRLTADNPLVDIEELDKLIVLHREKQLDYCHSFDALPIGVGAEIFSFGALEKCFQKGSEPHHLEHVNEYIFDYPDEFKQATYPVGDKKSFANLKLSVDTAEDYARVKYVFDHCKGQLTTEKAVKLCLEYA